MSKTMNPVAAKKTVAQIIAEQCKKRIFDCILTLRQRKINRQNYEMKRKANKKIQRKREREAPQRERE